MKEQLTKKNHTTIEDSITAGLLGAIKDDKGQPKCDVIPENDVERNKVVYHIVGDIETLIKEIYENCPVGALDVLRSIKSTRSAIFNLKGGRK